MSDQFDALQLEGIRGTPWNPVPGRESLHVPTNIEADGRIINDSGDVEGYAEDQHNEDRFNSGVDPTQDADLQREAEKQQKEEREKAKAKEKPPETDSKPKKSGGITINYEGQPGNVPVPGMGIAKEMVLKYQGTKGCR